MILKGPLTGKIKICFLAGFMPFPYCKMMGAVLNIKLSAIYAGMEPYVIVKVKLQ
jgi:hypothetical protein